jgi:predicted MPP superfamily phosphohydrolase
VVSGHLHGGQIVLPIIGGVYGADQGWFPKYVHGLYEVNKMNILITSGLSSNKKILPRWNNPPEILLVRLIPE